MSGKVKMRCARCGKPFKSSSPKQTQCPECEAKARLERASTKSSSGKPASVAATPAPAPKIVGPGAGILVPGRATATNSAPPATPAGAATSSTGEHSRGGHSHDTSAPRSTHAEHREHPEHASRLPQAQIPRPPKPAHERKPPTEPKTRRAPAPAFVLTDDLRAKIEARYLDLAQPVEFDGIRTQIATEMGIPKSIVKRTVLDLRNRAQMPSWWDLQAYAGNDTQLERVRKVYLPLLPLPPIGIHKEIADQLGLEPATVYQAIRRIRAEMRLPQYNPPDLHENGAEAAAAPLRNAGAQTGPAEAD